MLLAQPCSNLFDRVDTIEEMDKDDINDGYRKFEAITYKSSNMTIRMVKVDEVFFTYAVFVNLQLKN